MGVGSMTEAFLVPFSPSKQNFAHILKGMRAFIYSDLKTDFFGALFGLFLCCRAQMASDRRFMFWSADVIRLETIPRQFWPGLTIGSVRGSARASRQEKEGHPLAQLLLIVWHPSGTSKRMASFFWG